MMSSEEKWELLELARRGVEALEKIVSANETLPPPLAAPETDRTMIWVPEEDWVDLMRCARDGLIPPKPCTACNGVRKHNPWCKR